MMLLDICPKEYDLPFALDLEFTLTDAISSHARRPHADTSQLKNDQDIADWNAGKIPIALIQPSSAGHGLNLQSGGSTIIWFTMPWSLELYQQTNARLWRQGQRAESVVICSNYYGA